MRQELKVSTLLAAKETNLGDSDITSFAEFLTLEGCQIKKKTRINDRVADIFFYGRAGCFSTHKGKPVTFDVITQEAILRQKKILIADMESTIIEQEMLDELASCLGLGEKVSTITRRAMNGKIDFPAALKERVALLRGHPLSLLHKVAERMTLSQGAEQLVRGMKQAGAQCWLVSGGFNYFVQIISQRLGFDGFYANDVLVKEGVLTGEVALPILGKEEKRVILEKVCHDYGCTVSESLALGDGANDLPMLEYCQAQAGLSVAYKAKATVREKIFNQINHTDLTSLLYAQNLKA